MSLCEYKYRNMSYGGITGAPATGVQPLKYGGKELDRENGLDWLDFEARMYDPMLPQFRSIDRKCEDYPETSPFAYCAGNPVRYTDPTGMNPIYDRNGIYIGDTSEGFTGEVLVMLDGASFFTNYHKHGANQWLKSGLVKKLDDIQQSKDKNSRLSNDALSAIWTNILQHFNGLQVYDEIFTTFDMEGQRVFFEKDDDSNWGTYDLYATPKIVGSGMNFENYESTVENIASSLIVHEWYSHGKKHNSDTMLSHRLAYKNVINFKPLWNKTTPSYKRFVLRKLKEYTEKETGRKNVDSIYLNLYNKY